MRTLRTEENSKTARGLYLRVLRIEQGLNQAQLAKIVGAEHNTISRAEVGTHQPMQFIGSILRALKGSFDDWMDLENAPLEDGRTLAQRRLALLSKATPDQLRDIVRKRRQELGE